MRQERPLTAGLCQFLCRRVARVGLNVEATAGAALGPYEGLEFETIASYGGCLAQAALGPLGAGRCVFVPIGNGLCREFGVTGEGHAHRGIDPTRGPTKTPAARSPERPAEAAATSANGD